MLLSLNIKNYALIEELSVDFTEGLNILTGETGAGKSIIIESLGLILGERATSKIVRTGAAKCSITAQFDISKHKDILSLLDDKGLAGDEAGLLIIRREVDAGSRSRAFINDTPSSVESLKEIGEMLVDICGQSEHQVLSKKDEQRRLLDTFAQNETLKENVRQQYSSYKELLKKKEASFMSEAEKTRLIDLYSFQKKEIDEAKLSAGEDEEIETALPELKNAEKFITCTTEIHELLYASEDSALSKLEKSRRLAENIISMGGSISDALEQLNSGTALVQNASEEIAGYAAKLNLDPGRLNELLERRELINKLKKKYGNTIYDISAYNEKISGDLASLLRADMEKDELDRQTEECLNSLKKNCSALTASRKKAALKLVGSVQKELSELGMKKAVFEVTIVQTDEPGAEGSDDIEFIFSANLGQKAGPLKDIASGGEMSRVMLAIKSAFAKSGKTPLLIFDEIDAGVGGPMGQIVGRKLKNLSSKHQIISITHLPQIAAFSDNHLFVTKESVKSKTLTRVKTLSRNEKVEEIARMLSGEDISDSARKHALELIEASA